MIKEYYHFDHIDIMPLPIGQASLKIYGGRLHAPKMQELPIEPNALINASQRAVLREYCHNDLEVTRLLYEALKPQIELREKMGAQYGIDLRSNSDAQIAESVIKHELEAKDIDCTRPTVKIGTKYKYTTPKHITFKSQLFNDLVTMIERVDFVVGANGQIALPDELLKKISYDGAEYQLGIGGIHSCESSQAIIAKDDELLFDVDVASYYPYLIIDGKYYPKHLTPEFLTVYESIVNRRIEAKRKKDTVTADSLKITVNGSFGKFGSKYSFLYSPDLLINTTLTGQLTLLMLIERITLAGGSVKSANTDGIVILCKRDNVQAIRDTVSLFELDTIFNMEYTEYRALYSINVNNYLAVKPNGTTKGKGQFAIGGLAKNPTNTISVKAAIAYLTKKTPIKDTILHCQDIRDFITLRTVQGGAIKDGVLLGKAIRWYHSTSEQGAIHYAKNNNKVPKSDGAKPVMDYPDTLPTDIDYQFYIQEAKNIIKSTGVSL
ncbi:hypothetical protein [uncultured Agitococcus sp.]|uniref:hypothetical protein n=1 Tax=uncultured Agitococcus sp. TaxID=1506599 RepID=UPI00260227B8|nr:hypothetical protein [uncultured Agitococcus sp.]